MKLFRLGLNSLALTAADLIAVLIAFAIYSWVRARQPAAPQVLIQAPLAGVLSIAIFCGWCWALPRLAFKRLPVQGIFEWVLVYLGSLLWTPLIFVPLHYATQGYLTSFSNIQAIWLFQAPVNFLAVFAARQMQSTPLEPWEDTRSV